MARSFYIVVDGGRFPMKRWLRENPEHIPTGLDATSSTSHSLRNGLKKQGWIHEINDSEELLSYEELGNTSISECVEEEDAENSTSSGFVLESHLRDYLADNLELLPIFKSKLKIYVNPEGRDGVEYPTDVGFIDILAVDSKGDFYVFELKRSKGSDRVIGQIARYMGWAKATIAKGKNVYGVIVATDIDEKLKFAASIVPNVSLFEYQINFHLSEVQRNVC
ncbi:endonuclease NucS domain-containing protein [Vibrio rotiferianus]|uniref:endonuclease NucS domain-containing protein n=1 Tax=Vibrio rotiferianus TaxID=190895 RepID=UPI003980808E